MKKKVFVRFLVLAYIAVLLFGILTIGAGAASSYQTFSYSSSGQQQNSPNAYEVYGLYNAQRILLDERYKATYIEKRAALEMAVNGKSESDAKTTAQNDWEKAGLNAMNKPNAIRTDKEGRLYIADTGNNRILILKNDYTVYDVIDIFESAAADYDTFNEPNGVFVNDDYIYVSDTKNGRIVIFNKSDRSFYKLIGKPDTPLVKTDQWQPVACAVDQYGRIFVISQTATNGVIVLADDDGYFTGYIGAQKVAYNWFELFWRRFQSEEDRQKNVTFVSVTLNNITIDDEGFIYATSDKSDQGNDVPVVKLNSAGDRILKTNGFVSPIGEASLSALGHASNRTSSVIKDVAVGPEGTWSIIDYNRGRVYTYDSEGMLLFAFGDGGDGSGSTGKLGSLTHLQSLTYQLAPNQDEDAELETYNLILLDSFTSLFTVFTRTDYGDLLIEALAQENNREFSNAQEYWTRILQRNSNFDSAYVGVGKTLYRQGKYEEAEEYFKACFERDYYSKAFAELRKEWIGQSGHLVLIVLVAIVLIVLLVKGLGAAKKFNARTALKPGKKTYWEELVYPFHLVFHPFDGFWDLKHEKRGSVRGGLTILALTIVTFFYYSVGKGYIFSPRPSRMSIITCAISIIMPVFLWVTSNWCLTTLFDGEGSYRDVLIATCYSLSPLPPFFLISTLLTHVLTVDERQLVTLIFTFGLIWAFYLLFFGMLVTHGYSLPKNILTTFGTLLAASVISFVALLFSSLVTKMIFFVVNIVQEVSGRA